MRKIIPSVVLMVLFFCAQARQDSGDVYLGASEFCKNEKARLFLALDKNLCLKNTNSLNISKTNILTK